MSMEVDFSTPLTDEERAYLAERGRYADVERVDAMTGSEPQPFGEGDGTGLKQASVLTSDQMASERERLLARLAELNAMAPDADDDSDTEVAPYEEWTPQELKDELGRRGLPKSGTKADLVARLEENDREPDPDPEP
jgi:hypothetical protein